MSVRARKVWILLLLPSVSLASDDQSPNYLTGLGSGRRKEA